MYPKRLLLSMIIIAACLDQSSYTAGNRNDIIQIDETSVSDTEPIADPPPVLQSVVQLDSEQPESKEKYIGITGDSDNCDGTEFVAIWDPDPPPPIRPPCSLQPAVPQARIGVTIKDTDFDGLLSAAREKLVIVEFTKNACVFCENLYTQLLQDSVGNLAEAVIIKVHVDMCPGAVSEYGPINVHPTFVFLLSKMERGLRVLGFNPWKIKFQLAELGYGYDRVEAIDTISDFDSQLGAAGNGLIIVEFTKLRISVREVKYTQFLDTLTRRKKIIKLYVDDEKIEEMTKKYGPYTFIPTFVIFEKQTKVLLIQGFARDRIKSVINVLGYDGNPRIQVQEINTDADFDSALNAAERNLVVVVFTEVTCSECEGIYAQFLDGLTKYEVVIKVIISKCSKTSKNYGPFRTLPTFVFVKEKQERGRVLGFLRGALEKQVAEIGD